MKIQTRSWTLTDGTTCAVHDFITKDGLTVSILELGAAIQKITQTDASGNEQHLCLSFDNSRPYENRDTYAGCTLAPNAGRIQDSLLPVNGTIYPLISNETPNQLHGGPDNLSAVIWETAEFTCHADDATLLMTARQADGYDGYPGNRSYQVRYTIEDNHTITIEYAAQTDQPTYINMSNHTYWNLTGDGGGTSGAKWPESGFCDAAALRQQIRVPADRVCLLRDDHIPIQITPADNPVFDLRQTASFIDHLHALSSFAENSVTTEQVQIARGFDHAFVLDRDAPAASFPLPDGRQTAPLHEACVLTDPASGRSIRMLTDAPALVVYSGGFLPDGLTNSAIALEAQDVPNVMHLMPEAYRLATAERPFARTIRIQIMQEKF